MYGKLVLITLDHSTKGRIVEQMEYDASSKLFNTAKNSPDIGKSSYTIMDASGPQGYYVGETDSLLYSLKANASGEWEKEQVALADICAGAATEDVEFSGIDSFGSLLALRSKTEGKLTVCDTAQKKLRSRFPVDTAASTFKLAPVPLGKDKGGHKVVWSTTSNNKQQISETHFFPDSNEHFTIENMYSIEEDAVLQISGITGHSVFEGSSGLSAYLLAQPTQKYVPASSRRLLAPESAFDP